MSLEVLDKKPDTRRVDGETVPSSMPLISMGTTAKARRVNGSGKRSHGRRRKKRRVRETRQNATRRSPAKRADRRGTKEIRTELSPAVMEERHTEKKARNHSSFPRTDAGNAELFAALYGKMFRYDHKRQRWLKWSGHWWVEDKRGIVIQFAKNAARYRLRQSAHLEDEERKAEARWAFQSESRFRLDAMLKLARSEHPLNDSGENWDHNPWLLGVANGVLDLRTGKLRNGKQEDQITMHTNVLFDPNAKSELWLKFLKDIFDGNQELIDYVQRCIGYCLTGSTKEETIFYAHGSGANGKSTFLEAIRYALGPFAGAAPFSMFEQKSRAPIPSDVASTVGKRFITASETDESVRLNESRIKAMTGGDTQMARFMFKDWFEFEASGKIWLAFNHKPEITDESNGMWRRIRLIPFNRRFDGTEQDKTLKEKLRVEAAGILAWAVQGCLEWQRRGLNAPAIVHEATQAYRKESDTLGSFLEECCDVGAGISVSSADLRNSYSKWAAANGAGLLSPRVFKNRLESRGFKSDRIGHDRTRSFVGLGLKPIPNTLDVAATGQPVGRKSMQNADTFTLPSAFNSLIPQ